MDTALTTDSKKRSSFKGKNFDKAKVTCHQCGKKGHYAPKCTQEQQTGEQMLMSVIASVEFDKTDNLAFQFHQLMQRSR
jgi:hypothetical protein